MIPFQWFQRTSGQNCASKIIYIYIYNNNIITHIVDHLNKYNIFTLIFRCVSCLRIIISHKQNGGHSLALHLRQAFMGFFSVEHHRRAEYLSWRTAVIQMNHYRAHPHCASNERADPHRARESVQTTVMTRQWTANYRNTRVRCGVIADQ